MADIVKMARTAAAITNRPQYPAKNRAYKDGSLQTQYFQNETAAYISEMGSIASNVYMADCQGLNSEDFFEWRKVKLRSVRAAQAQTGSTMPGDWQRIFIVSPANCTYLPQGAMLKYADNTWIVFKDKNISAIFGSAIVRRCNAVINLLDWYGNVVHLPISYAKMETLGNAPHTTENTITSKNYIACICQINEYSEAFRENTRIILGKTAYAMRGLDDFTREFTDDPDSAHLLTFTIERTNLQSYDNTELGVADYYGLSWDIDLSCNGSMLMNTTQTITATSQRNGASADGDEAHPVSYIYESSDESVLTVDETGLVTAVGKGTASITVSLAQNPDVQRTVEIEVPAAEPEFVAFTSTIPAVIHEYTPLTVSAAYFREGEARTEPLTITFEGAENGAYTAVPADTPNTYVITAYHATAKPLTITARYGAHSASAVISIVT